MEKLKYLTDYYNSYDEDGRLTSKHGQVEFITTVNYIDKYLKKGMRVLEVGAEKGFQVDVVELIQHNIDILKSKIAKNYNIDVRQGNAIDLSCYEDETFDITLVPGPLYHLFDDDKKQAISEAIRVTKKGGVVFVSYCMNDATIADWGFQKGNIIEGIQNGIVDKDIFKCLSNPSLLFEMHRKDEMDEKIFETYLRYHFSICERTDLIGMTHHSLDIFRK